MFNPSSIQPSRMTRPDYGSSSHLPIRRTSLLGLRNNAQPFSQLSRASSRYRTRLRTLTCGHFGGNLSHLLLECCMSFLYSHLFKSSVMSIPILLATGCSCNEYDLTPFQGYEELEDDHGQWLSMKVSPDNRLAVAYFDRTFGALGFALGEPQDDGTVGLSLIHI